MNDEITIIARGRPGAPPYSPEAKAAARRRLTDGPRGRGFAAGLRQVLSRRPYGVAIGGIAVVTAAAVIAVTVQPGQPGQPGGSVVVPAAGRGAGSEHGPEVVVALPRIAKMSAAEVLGKAARAASDLRPRDDQFIKVSSQTMYGSFSGGEVNGETGETVPESRYLYRTKRTIWLSADGTRDGVLKVEYLPPRAYPGWPIPDHAYEDQGTEWHRLPACGQERETAYPALQRLPADAEGMRAHLYARAAGDGSPDAAAWRAVGDLLRETYLPAAQRAALFQAAATIPGVTVTEDAEDAAGRRGIGVGRESAQGVREDIIFDPETYELLGERGVVVDAAKAGSPVGSLVASTAQLEVTVEDGAPEVGKAAEMGKAAEGCG